jgi:hypothetical protein
VSELTPREWQDIEKAKAALRIDSGWDDVDAMPAVVAQDVAHAATALEPDAVLYVGPEPDLGSPLPGDPPVSTPPPAKSTPESRGVPTAG